MKPDAREERGFLKWSVPRRKLWRRTVAVLACVVVFCTTYALILPAITLSEDTYCGKEEHTHTEECYELRLICGYDAEQLPETEPEPTKQPHIHTEDCWQTREELTCTIPEGHIHDESCYTRPLVCGQEEGETHTHSEECLGEPELICTLEEDHVHTADCYTQETELVCGLEEWIPDPTEETSEPEEEAPAHVHTDECYENVLICSKEEHIHTLSCYSDPQADLETPDSWRQSLPGDLTENWSENILAVARSQLGYSESTRNYLVDDGNGIHGYTRYGAWAGDPYGDWNTRFVSFCLRYANVPSTVFPDDEDCARWLACLSSGGSYRAYGPDAPAPGDILFLDTDGDSLADRVGVYTGSGTDENGEVYLETIEGDCGGTVNTARHGAQAVLGFGRIPENPDSGKYTCGILAHVHESSCYTPEGALQCGFAAHTHDDACRTGIREFDYEDDALSMHITVEGPKTEDLTLDVAVLDGEDFALFSDRQQRDAEITGEESGADAATDPEDADTGLLLLRGLSLLRGEDAQDLENYKITARITVAPSVLEPLTKEAEALEKQAAPEADLGVVISALRENADQTVTEAATADYRPGDGESPQLTVQVEKGIVALSVDQYPNPHYTVQYYANIPRFANSGEKSLQIFDTTGGRLPTNGGTNPVKQIYLNPTGDNTTKNAGNATANYKVATEKVLTRMYTDNAFEYIKSPNTSYVNKLIDNDSYILKEVWVLKDGKDPASANEADWDVYKSPENLHFTSRETQVTDGVLLIKENTCLRLVYACRDAEFTTPSTFYDYDISSGQNANGTWRTGITGINIQGNYGTSRNGETTWRSYRDALAFGNANCGTGMANYRFAGIYLNQHSKQNEGCTFGLVDSLSDGKIVYNDWLIAPNLFNEGDANGKHTYANSSLTFNKVGDTYTLSSAKVNGLGDVTGLENFFHPSPNSTTTHEHILTNDFWPLDSATNKTDPLFGANGKVVNFQGFESTDGNNGTWVDQAGQFPASDDGREHNSFFGMQYAVTFTLSKDYVGPLEYYFFGDDDMWVFLDDKLVCDIGGVHSSVGEYVNLWDYLNQGEEGTHTLTFFYTERGASGSTCYMNFTLPSVSGVNIEQKTARLRVEKQVVGEGDPTKEFQFQIRFFDRSGNPILDDYAYTRYSADGTRQGGNLIICSGDTFSLRDGEYVLIDYLPYGLRYQITEVTQDGYSVSNTVDGVLRSGAEASGTVIMDVGNTVTFINTLKKVGLQLQKLDPDGKPLAGAVFSLADSTGSPVNAVDQGDGNYKIPASAADQIVDQGEYYIAAAKKDDEGNTYVLGMDAGAGQYDAKLQKKTGAANQRFRVYRQPDGSYSFLCLDGTTGKNMWLDLDGGNLTNGTLVHFWDNAAMPTSHDNQKWFLVTNADGSYTFKPRVAVLEKSKAVMDLNAANIEEGERIQAWESNGTDAQKWLLVPLNAAAAETTTQEFKVNGNGVLRFTGLLPGTYTLTETQAPANCIPLDKHVTIKVNASGEVTVSGNSLVRVDGGVVQVTNRFPDKTLTLEKKVLNNETAEKFAFTVSYTDGDGTAVERTLSLANGEKQTLSIPYNAQVTIREGEHKGFALSFKQGETVLPTGEDGSCTFTMKDDVTILAVNTAGYELPKTGGSGTAAFTAWGILLIAAACLAIYFRAIRRREKPSF